MAKVRDLMTDTASLPVLIGSDRMAVQVALEHTRRLYRPAFADEISKVLSELSILPRKQAGDSEASFKHAAYVKHLSDLPKWALTRAVSEWIAAEKWFPTPSEIRAIASRHIGKAKWREAVMKRWLEREAPRIDDQCKGSVTIEEMAKVKPIFRRMAIAKEWITRQEVEAAGLSLDDPKEERGL